MANDPDSLAFAHLGARLIDEGEYQSAIEVCQKGLEKHPDYSFGHFILGTAHYHVKNYTDAKKELEKALAYDPNNPRAWEILSAINEILNLSDDSQESNLQSYLIDFLNKDAPSQYVFEIDAPTIPRPSETAAEISGESPILEESVEKEQPEKDLGEMLDDVLSGSEEEYDFDKALNDVFKDKEEQAILDDESIERELSETKDDATSEIVPSEKEGLVSAEEFTSAIESFFADYEDEEKEAAKSPEIPEESVEEEREFTPAEDESEETSVSIPFEEIDDTDASEDEILPVDDLSEGEQSSLTLDTEDLEQHLEESPAERQPDDEFLDFQSFVSDVIKDTEEPSQIQEMDADQEDLSGIEESEIDREIDRQEGSEKTFPEEELEIPGEADFETPLPPLEELTGAPEKSAEVPLHDSDDSSESTPSPKFSKPPILSPTLGEIYIAQGRFEEAIVVFKQLLEKDPDNSRFKRKITDLQNIVAKKKLG